MTIQLPTTKEQYYLIVNHELLYIRAVELGYDNVVLFTGIQFRNRDLAAFKVIGKSVFLLFFCPEGDVPLNQLRDQLDNIFIKCEAENLYNRDAGRWLKEVKTLNRAVKRFPRPEETRSFLEENGIIKSTDYRNRCGKCHELLRDGAKYCVYCGTARGKGAFRPYENIVPIVYGPPYNMELHCANCGEHWKSQEWLKYPEYCPRCGKATVVVDDEYCDLDYLN